eukprot:TRINITY_DN19174_c0_g2_i1.p1 TRINITY_DN19174_c0_g2~~TRINITY_DN19174_c0_g2_i1.p1  ORF type:complete len:470 (-),score=133.78 TRINITY_DN19174_c0_g2_i1:98-1507(-)
MLPLLLGAALLPGFAESWHTWGVLPAYQTFHVYVGKFCYDYSPDKTEKAGTFSFAARGKVLEGSRAGSSTSAGGLFLLVYDDEEDRWKRVRDKWDTITCEELLQYASFKYPISPLDGSINRTVPILESQRPRFWYFAFAACGVESVMDLEYELHAENILQGIQSEFSMDKVGCLGLQLAASFVFVAIAYGLRVSSRSATGAEALRSRPLARLLLISSTCSAAGASSLALHNAIFMVDGEGYQVSEVFGQLMNCCAKASLTVLMLLTAKGWALFYAPEELIRRQVMICLFGGIIALSVTCEIHADYFRDWSTTLYLYESGPGFVILAMNTLLYLEAWRSMRETYRHEASEEVRVFYILVSTACSLYFLTLPLICILAAAFDPWVRFYYVSVAEVFSRLVSTVLLAICIRPSRLDAMVNARLEDGLETVGELRDDISEEDDEDYYAAEKRACEDEYLTEPLYHRSELAPAE